MRLILVAIPILTLQFDECRFSAPREAVLDATNAASVYVSAGAGSMRVEGRPGLRQARIRGTACASDRDLLDQIQLTATRSGTELRIHVNDEDFELRSRQYARLDVVIEVPENIAAEIEDGSGELDVAGLGDLTVIDGSGELTLQDIAGNVEVEDGSGEIRVNTVRGSLRIEDGSGRIELHDVGGPVVINDGSGDVNITKVTRDVTISDSSGSIEIDEVGGNFTVRSDGSGGIDYRRINGTVSVPRSRDSGWRNLLQRGRL
jgi:hypothetical protein